MSVSMAAWIRECSVGRRVAARCSWDHAAGSAPRVRKRNVPPRIDRKERSLNYYLEI